jgi:hypothetical protein
MVMPVHHRARATQRTTGDLLVDGKPTLALDKGEAVGVVWEEGDGWSWVRSESRCRHAFVVSVDMLLTLSHSATEGYVRAEVLQPVRTLPPGAGAR